MPQPARYRVVLHHVLYKILELPKNSELDDFFLIKSMHSIDEILALTDEELLELGTYSDCYFGDRPRPPSIPIQQKEHIRQLRRWREQVRNNGFDIREQDWLNLSAEDYRQFLRRCPTDANDTLEALQAASPTTWTIQSQPYGALPSPSDYVWYERSRRTPTHRSPTPSFDSETANHGKNASPVSIIQFDDDERSESSDDSIPELQHRVLDDTSDDDTITELGHDDDSVDQQPDDCFDNFE